MKSHKDATNLIPKSNHTDETFGLGIQVFKIESKKDVPPNATKGKNVSHKQVIQNIENPNALQNARPPPLPKNKKTSAVLPVLNRTNPQKETAEESFPQT